MSERELHPSHQETFRRLLEIEQTAQREMREDIVHAKKVKAMHADQEGS